MKKKFSFLTAIFLISQSALAYVNTTTYVPPMSYGRNHQAGSVATRHTYTVTNDSNVVQNVSVCMITHLCWDAPTWNRKQIESCDNYTLKPGETKSRQYDSNLDYYYEFYGYCDVDASTEITGWQHFYSNAHGKLYVQPFK